MDTTKFKEVSVIFQSIISVNKTDLSHEYDLVHITVNENKVILPPPLDPPVFKETLQTVTIEQDFYHGTDFPVVTFEFPDISDPYDREVLPINIIGIDDYPYLEFDEKLIDNKKLKIDPNKFPDDIIDTIVII